MQIKEKIENWIKETLEIEKVSLTHPKEIKNGDFAFFAGGQAGEFGRILNEKKISEVEKVEVVGPFVNFYLSEKFFTESVGKILKSGDNFGKTNLLKGQKVIIEYTNTNVLKPMHIGHLMGNVIGQSVSNVMEAVGAEVRRNTYQGDVGLHIAKAVWGIRKNGGIIKGSLKDTVDYIGKAYALGSNSYEDDQIAQEEIKEINKKIFNKNDQELLGIYKWGREVSLAHFEDLYKKLGTKFDYYFFESEVANDAVNIVREFLKKGVFEESDNAVVFRGEKYDSKLHTRVFLTEQGIPTYEAKDIAHALRKETTFQSDKSIIITANEQDGYFEVVLKALEQINSEVAQKTKHLSHGMLKLPTGKMSSRKGNVITGEALISDVEDLVKNKLSDRNYSDMEKAKITESVAIGAIKYSILRQAIGGDIVFDFDKSISFEGDSGPYLQYTFVRAKSVLEKSKFKIFNFKSIFKFFNQKIKRPENFGITDLERFLYRFPEVVERAGREFAPHYLVTYLTELAGLFNSFYGNTKIIDEGQESEYKLAVTKSVETVLKNGLKLLGIQVPDRM